LKTATIYGNVKVEIIKQTDKSTLVKALEDALVRDDRGELRRIEAGKHYIFCSCCFTKRKEAV